MNVDEYAARFDEEPGYLDFARFGPIGAAVVEEEAAIVPLLARARFGSLDPMMPLILINHFPLRENLLRRMIKIPRFSLWCGTRRTENWHTRFPTTMVVYGHLHIRATDIIDEVRFEEVSLGYPRQWDVSRGVQGYLRQLLPRQ